MPTLNDNLISPYLQNKSLAINFVTQKIGLPQTLLYSVIRHSCEHFVKVPVSDICLGKTLQNIQYIS